MNTFSGWPSFSTLTIAILISSSSAAALAKGQLRGDITSAEIVAHDASLKGQLPQGRYNVVLPPYEAGDFVITGGYVADQECWKLVEMNQANSVSQETQKKYAKILGFKECRATPIVKGLISRSCQLAFQCSGPIVQPEKNIRIVTLLADFDYDPKNTDLIWPCGDAAQEITSIDGKNVAIFDGEMAMGDDVTFSGKNAKGQMVSGCRFRVYVD